MLPSGHLLSPASMGNMQKGVIISKPSHNFLIFIWYIPSEKIGQNIDPLRNSFFVTKYQHWTGTSVLEPFLGPPDPWGGLGRHGGVLGGLPPPKMPLSFRD